MDRSEYMNSLYLAHHGVKGQKWGERRYQNEDGTLTEEGKKRYLKESLKADMLDAKESVEFYKKNARKELTVQSSNQYVRAKEDYKDSKTRYEMAGSKIQERKSFKSAKQKYLDNGMTEDEASIKAYRDVTRKRTIAIASTVTLAAATALAGYKLYDYMTDKDLPAGTILKRISLDGSKTVNDTFYAAYKNSDVRKYEGLFGGEKAKIAPDSSVYQKSIQLDKSHKIASEKTGRDIYNDLMKNDPEFKKMVTSGVFSINDDNYGKLGSYMAFNRNLVNPYFDKAKNTYMSKLAEKGYAGIIDSNDKRLSGYKAKAPVIMRKDSGMTVTDVRQLDKSKLKSKYTAEYAKLLSSTLAKNAALYGTTLALTKKVANTVRDSNYKKVIANYKKEHPNTEMSNTEILNTVYGYERKSKK